MCMSVYVDVDVGEEEKEEITEEKRRREKVETREKG